MKRILLSLITILTLAAFAPAEAGAQAKLATKKMKIGDFTARTTKVVLKGNDLTDSALREEVTARWRISPFEFCTVDEFNTLKQNPQYYFLMTESNESGKFHGLVTLTLFKGGLASSDDPSKVSVDILRVPLCSSIYPDGREMVFMPALLDIMQDYVQKAIQHDSDAYRGLELYSGNVRKSGHKDIFFSEDDVVQENVRLKLNSVLARDGMVMDEDADGLFMDGRQNSLFAYTVAPSEPKNGDWSHQLLIDAESHQLYYYSRHKITESKWAGFTSKDIKKIAAARKKKRK